MEKISEVVKNQSGVIWEEIKKAKSILLHCHPQPDPDSVCSALSMKLGLESIGKKVTIVSGDSGLPSSFMHFPGADTIISKNFFEINLLDFDLFIILDSSSPEMISRLGSIDFPLKQLKTVVIDHHVSNKGYADINLVDTSSPATAFTIYQLLRLWQVELSHDIAINLYMGMYTDTGGFKYPGTDYRVLAAASDCAKIAPDYIQSIFIMENSEPKESVYFLALALNSIETFCGDSVAIVGISQKKLKESKINPELVNTHFLASFLKTVIGWQITAQMIEIEPNKIKISFRTRDSARFDLSKLALSLGGGGHKAAAGAIVNGTIEDAKNLVLSKIKDLYNI